MLLSHKGKIKLEKKSTHKETVRSSIGKLVENGIDRRGLDSRLCIRAGFCSERMLHSFTSFSVMHIFRAFFSSRPRVPHFLETWSMGAPEWQMQSYTARAKTVMMSWWQVRDVQI
jgi:hypothetical protein